MNDLRVIDVFIDDPGRRPCKRISHLAIWIPGQRTHAQFNIAQAGKRLAEMRPGDPDKSGSKTALRYHHTLRSLCHLSDRSRRSHVFGQIEVMDSERVRNPGDGKV